MSILVATTDEIAQMSEDFDVDVINIEERGWQSRLKDLFLKNPQRPVMLTPSSVHYAEGLLAQYPDMNLLKIEEGQPETSDQQLLADYFASSVSLEDLNAEQLLTLAVADPIILQDSALWLKSPEIKARTVAGAYFKSWRMPERTVVKALFVAGQLGDDLLVQDLLEIMPGGISEAAEGALEGGHYNLFDKYAALDKPSPPPLPRRRELPRKASYRPSLPCIVEGDELEQAVKDRDVDAILELAAQASDQEKVHALRKLALMPQFSDKAIILTLLPQNKNLLSSVIRKALSESNEQFVKMILDALPESERKSLISKTNQLLSK